MSFLDFFKSNNDIEIVDTLDYFYVEPGDYSLSNETFVNSIFDDHAYYDPKMIKLYKCDDTTTNDDILECFAICMENPCFTNEIEWVFANQQLEIVNEQFNKLREERECKEKFIDDLDSWENSINENLENGYVEIRKLPIQQHGYFAKVNLFNDDNVLIEEGIFTTQIETLQEKIDGNNINKQISNALDIDVNEICSVKIVKKKESAGFDRYYDVEIELSVFYFSFVSVIPGEFQGREKNIFSIIEDDLIEAYEETKKDYEEC